MPEPRSFGRRAAAGSPRPVMAPVADDAASRGSTVDRLDTFSRRLRVAGELVGFGGLLLYLVSSVFWQAIAIDTSMLKVYIPPALQGAIDLSLPAIKMVNQNLVPVVGSLAWPLFGLVGAIAMVRRRYLLGLLCVAPLCFPWWVFGADLPFGSILAVILLGIGAIRYFAVKGMALAVTVVLGLVVGVPLVGYCAMLVDHIIWPSGVPSVTYAVVDGANFDPANGPPVIDVSALPGKTPPEAAGKAFVMAQLATIRQDVPGVVAALQIIDAAPVRPNSFEAYRIETARNFASHQGAFGPESKTRTDRLAGTIDSLSMVIRVAGIVLGLFGPFAGALAGIVTRRSQRIGAAEVQLAMRRVQPSGVPNAGRSFGRVQSAQPLQSFAASEGEAVIGQITGRVNFYSVAMLALGAVAVLAVLASLLMWLPPANSNTAFDAVDLMTAGGTWAMERGLAVQTGLAPLEDYVAQWLIGGLVLAAIAYRLRKPIGVGIVVVMLGGLIYWQISSLFFFDHAQYEARPANVTALRGELESIAARATTIPLPKYGSISVGELRKLAEKAQADSTGLPSGTAAFILAQLAYLEGNAPETAKELLRVGTDPSFVFDATTAEDQRTDLMQEWAVANGKPVDIHLKRYSQIAPMAAVRAVAQPLLWVGLASGALAILALALSIIATQRTRRLQDLVAEARQVSR